MRKWLSDRPWIWLVVLLAGVALINLVMVVIAASDPPIRVD